MGLKRVKTQTKSQLINPIRRQDPVYGVKDDGYSKLLDAQQSKRSHSGGQWPDAQ